MASVRYRVNKKDGTIVWQVLFRLDDKQTSDTFKNERAARQFARMVETLGGAEARKVQDARENSAETTPTLEQWCATYIDGLTGVQDGTKDRYRRIVETKLGSLGKIPVDAVSVDGVAKWVNGLDGTLAGKTISNYHGFLSGAMKAALRRKLITSNPCEGTRLPRTEREEMVILTPAEFATFLGYVREDARDMVTVLPATGLRFGEITALQVRDIDVKSGTLTVSRAWKYVEKGAPVYGPPKSKKSRRTIRIPAMAVEALAHNAKGKAPDDLLFTNTAGQPWTRSRFHEGVWQPAVRAANAKPVDKDDKHVPLGKKPRVHDMRHTCASWLLASGADMYTVQRYLGHESFTTTESVYAHMDPVRMNRAADALSLVLPQIGR